MFLADPGRKYIMEKVPVQKFFPVDRQNHTSQNSQIISLLHLFFTDIFPSFKIALILGTFVYVYLVGWMCKRQTCGWLSRIISQSYS